MLCNFEKNVINFFQILFLFYMQNKLNAKQSKDKICKNFQNLNVDIYF